MKLTKLVLQPLPSNEVAQSCLTLCDPVDCSPPGSSVHGILQARILDWVAISFSRVSSQPGIEPTSPALAGGFFTTSTTREAPFQSEGILKPCWPSAL